MGLLKLIFRATTRTKRRRWRKTSATIVTTHQTKQPYSPQPIPHSEKVRHQNDIDRIQALPLVKVVHVIDGDTVIVSTDTSEIKIRLDSIDCPEDVQEWGVTATRGLIKQIGGKTVRLESHGTDGHGRTLGTLFVYLQDKGEWQNVNERMVTLGHAWVMRLFYSHLPISRQQKLNQLERWAKSKRVGLWKTDNPIPPWKWRKQ
jgi:endonuclease YncB( thermonuclease family)